jgi:hypothetical protein
MNNTIFKGGEIEVRESRRGIELRCFNFERQRVVHIGTVAGATYEKVAVILRQPELSFALTQSEFAAVLETGAQFIRIVPPDKSATYAISVSDFQKHAEPHYHHRYGPQLRCALIHFSRTSKVAPRNSVTDNPAIETPGLQIKQISLFQ